MPCCFKTKLRLHVGEVVVVATSVKRECAPGKNISYKNRSYDSLTSISKGRATLVLFHSCFETIRLV